MIEVQKKAFHGKTNRLRAAWACVDKWGGSIKYSQKWQCESPEELMGGESDFLVRL